MECTTVEQGDVGIVACEGEEVREILGVGKLSEKKSGMEWWMLMHPKKKVGNRGEWKVRLNL